MKVVENGGVRGHWTSTAMSAFERAHMTSCFQMGLVYNMVDTSQHVTWVSQ